MVIFLIIISLRKKHFFAKWKKIATQEIDVMGGIAFTL
jgi:hypothetical protein